MIEPDSGFRGTHVFASDGELVFDYHGWSEYARFIAHYFQKISRFFPGWSGRIIDISDDFWCDAWFERTVSRKPSQYFADPTVRANAFIERYAHRRPGLTFDVRKRSNIKNASEQEMGSEG